MNKLKLVLFLGLALNSAFPKTVFSDLFVFRTGNIVYSLSNLESYSQSLTDLECFYPASLVAEYYKELSSPPKGYYVAETFKSMSKKPTYAQVTERFVGMMKMIRYASSQSVSVNSDLPKAFKLSAQKRGCSLRGFEGDGLTEEMMGLAFIEVFLRSRFAPGESGELEKKRVENILNNVSSLEESVKNQIDHELFEY